MWLACTQLNVCRHIHIMCFAVMSHRISCHVISCDVMFCHLLLLSLVLGALPLITSAANSIILFDTNFDGLIDTYHDMIGDQQQVRMPAIPFNGPMELTICVENVIHVMYNVNSCINATWFVYVFLFHLVMLLLSGVSFDYTCFCRNGMVFCCCTT